MTIECIATEWGLLKVCVVCVECGVYVVHVCTIIMATACSLLLLIINIVHCKDECLMGL